MQRIITSTIVMLWYVPLPLLLFMHVFLTETTANATQCKTTPSLKENSSSTTPVCHPSLAHTPRCQSLDQVMHLHINHCPLFLFLFRTRRHFYQHFHIFLFRRHLSPHNILIPIIVHIKRRAIPVHRLA